jgi:hypothetical protein
MQTSELPSSAPGADPGRVFFVVARGEPEGLIEEIVGLTSSAPGRTRTADLQFRKQVPQ